MTNKFLLRSFEVLALSGLLSVPQTLMAERLYFESVSIIRGETIEMPLILENDAAVYGFQLDMTIPYGLELVMDGDEPDITLTSRMSGDYNFTYNFRDDQTLGIATFSTTHTPVSGNDGAVAVFKISANDSYDGGGIDLKNVICISKDNKDIRLEDEYTDIKVFIPVESVMVSQSSAVMKVGEGLTLTATVLPEGATDIDVVWSSDNESVATVSEGGYVEAIKEGEAIITASSSNGISASCQVTVSAREIRMEAILLDVEELALEVGDTYQFAATVVPSDTTYPELEWWIDNETIASIDQNGLVRMLAEGETTVHVRSVKWQDVQASCHLNVISGVARIIDDDVLCDIYSPAGILVRKEVRSSEIDNLPPGLYLIHQQGKTTKLLK